MEGEEQFRAIANRLEGCTVPDEYVGAIQSLSNLVCLSADLQGMAISEGVADSVVSALGKRKCGTLQEGYAACVQIIRSLMKCSDGPEWLLQSGAMDALVGCLTDPNVGSSAQSETILVFLTLSAGQNEKAMLDAGVVEALVSYLKEAKEDSGPMQVQYVVFAMKVLMNLSVPEVQERFVAAGGIETLVARLGSGIGEQRLQVLKNLMNLGASMEMKVPMVNKGVIQALSKLVEDSEAGGEETLLSLKVLMNIASHKETKVTMVESGVVDMMLRLCSKEGVERDYQLQCLKVMMSLATHQDTKVPMVQKGAVGIAVTLAGRASRSDDTEITIECVKTLMNLASHMETKRAMLSDGALEVLISSYSSGQSDLQLNALRAIASLSVGDGVEEDIVKRGVLGALIPAASGDGAAAGTELQLQALNSLMNLCAASGVVKSSLVQGGAVEALCKALSAAGDLGVQAAKALANLCVGRDIAAEIAGRGAAEALMKSVASEPHAPGGIREHAIKALSYLCSGDEAGRDALVSLGVVDTLLSVTNEATSSGGGESVKAEALRGLLHLSFCQQGKQILAQQGAMASGAAVMITFAGTRDCAEAGLMIVWQVASCPEGKEWYASNKEGEAGRLVVAALTQSWQSAPDEQTRSRSKMVLDILEPPAPSAVSPPAGDSGVNGATDGVAGMSLRPAQAAMVEPIDWSMS